MSRYQFTPQAVNDLSEICSYIAENSVPAADRVEEAVFRACDFLADRPFAGRVRPDLTPLPVRFWAALPYHNYFIVYDPETEPLRVIRIIHAARDLPSILI
jgi:plasmid stabilization system protein ParE